MKLTHRWLEDFCPHGKSPQEVAALLQSLGHEVAGVTALPGGDARIELEITANRPDCLSVLGLAHEVSAATGVPVRASAAPEVPPGKGPEVSVEDPAACPLYTARLIRNVKVGPSALTRLEAIGSKPISNVVDATNDVLYELGQPLHAFDADKLKGGIRVRRAKAGEKLKTLDGLERVLTPEMLVIADGEKPVALAGIMGGMDTAVSASTRNVLLESAVFDPGIVRRTSRALKLASDSSYRFERGVDPAGVLAASARAAALIGGEAGPLTVVGTLPAPPKAFVLRKARLSSILGTEIPPAEVERILKGLGCGVSSTKEGWSIQPPTRRARDLRTEAEAAEEVARVFGYDRIPGRISLPARPAPRDPARDLAAGISERLRACGFSEAVTTSFADAKGGSVRLANPMSAEQTHLRKSLVPGLLSALAHNQSVGEPGGRLFEIGRAYTEAGESWRLALAAEADLRLVKGAVLSLSEALASDPGEGGIAFRLGGQVLGTATRMQAEGLKHPAAVAELLLEPLLSAPREKRFQALPRFPAVERDLAVVVDEGVSWGRLEEAAKAVPCAFRERIFFFDLYRGKQAGAGKKSIAFSIRFRHAERTLSGDEVDAVMAATVSALEKACGAQIRK